MSKRTAPIDIDNGTPHLVIDRDMDPAIRRDFISVAVDSPALWTFRHARYWGR